MKLRTWSCLLLLCLPSLCLAELNPYQQNVVATFAASGTEAPVRAAYEALNAGKATDAQRKVIRTSEMIHEDLRLAGCVHNAFGTDMSFEAAIEKVVAAGQAAAMVADAKALFGQGEWEGAITATEVHEQALQVALLLAESAKPQQETESAAALRALSRRMTLDYYLAYATDGKCKASPQLRKLLGKGSK
jgi:hypothetical protein